MNTSIAVFAAALAHVDFWRKRMRPDANCSAYTDKTLDPETAALLEQLGIQFHRYVLKQEKSPRGMKRGSLRGIAHYLTKDKKHKVSEGTLRGVRDCMRINDKGRIKYRYVNGPSQHTLRGLLLLNIPLELRATIQILLEPLDPWAPTEDAANTNVERQEVEGERDFDDEQQEVA